MKRILEGLVLACVLAQPAPALAAAGPAIDFEEFRLENGLRVILSRDPAVPVTAVAMIFDVGGRHEVPGRSGFAHLFEHLMFEGSKNVPKGSFDRILESYGGDNNASTHADFTLYHEVVPSNALPIALWLDADRVGALNVGKEAVSTQIEVVKEEKRMRVDNEPYGSLLYVDMASQTFSNWRNAHPVIGSFEDLDAADLKDVRDFFETYYAPSNAIMAIVGDVNPEEAKKLVLGLFGGIPSHDAPAPPDLGEPPPSGERSVSLQDPHARLPALGFTWKGMPERGTQDFFALTLLGRALFLGKGARLYQELVKDSQVAVSVEGGLGFPVADADEYKAPGLFGGFVLHKSERDPSTVKALVNAQVARLAKEGLTDLELDRVKTKFRSDWIMERQESLGRAQALLKAALLDGDAGAANSLDGYMAVGPQDIRRVAAKYLLPAASTWFMLKPGAAP
jgi:predicted Zn-dependent peptidase